jgi:hypothetical protein
MNIQAQIGPETVALPEIAFPAPRSGESKTAARRQAFDSPVEPRPATTTDVTDVQSSAPAARPRLITYSLAALGITCLVCGCVAAASLFVVAGEVLPLIGVVSMLFGLFVIGQAVGRRPASGEMYDIR